MYERVELTRDELYQKVWDRPTVQVAAELGISDVMVGKICRRMDVPKPPLGYWRRKETGKKVKTALLPAANERTVQTVYLSRRVVTASDPTPSEIQTLIEKEHLPENQIRIAKDLENAHPLVERARQFFEGADRSQNEAVQFPQGDGYLNISVTPPLFDRALRIADALIKALEDRGYKIVVSSDHWRGEVTRVRKDEEAVEISFYEQIIQVRRELTTAEKKKPPYLITDPLEFRPTGKLYIKIRSHYSTAQVWRDKQDQALEKRLNEVVIGVITTLEVLVLETRRRVEAENRRLETIRRREEETDRQEKLKRDAANWAACNNIRSYLKAYRARLIEIRGRITEGSDEAVWLEWAETYVERTDPLSRISGDTDNTVGRSDYDT